MAVGRGVATPGSGTTESGGMVVCREEGEERHENGLHPGHITFTYVRYTKNDVVVRTFMSIGVYTHIQYTGYRSTRLTSRIDCCLLRRAGEGQRHWRQGRDAHVG